MSLTQHSACSHSAPACEDCCRRFEFSVRRAEAELRKRDREPATKPGAVDPQVTNDDKPPTRDKASSS
jgi:hypothetical protein